MALQEQEAKENKKKVRAAYMRFYRSVRAPSIYIQFEAFHM